MDNDYIKVEKISNNGYAIFISPRNISKNKLKEDLDNIISEICKENSNNDYGININIENKKLSEIQEKNLGKRYKGQLFIIYYFPNFFPEVYVYTHKNYKELREYIKKNIENITDYIIKYIESDRKYI